MINQAKLRSYRTAPKYIFGFVVQRNYAHAKEVNSMNKNTRWQDEVSSETISHQEYNTFNDKGINIKITEAYKRTRFHYIFGIKRDVRHKSMLVDDENLTEFPLESVYSDVVRLKFIILVIFLSNLNNLQSFDTDIGNAYLEVIIKKKFFIISDPWFI